MPISEKTERPEQHEAIASASAGRIGVSWLGWLGGKALGQTLLSLVAVSLLAGTLLHRVSPSAARHWIYASPWFLALALLLGLSSLGRLVLTKPWRAGRWGELGLCLAVPLLVAGGFVSFTEARSHRIVLPEGATRLPAPGREGAMDFPLPIRLERFTVEREPGGAARQYTSVVRVGPGEGRRAEIRVNRPLRAEGWTVSQAGYLPAEGAHPAASVLIARRDPGVPLAYAGYVALLLGLFLPGGLGDETGRAREPEPVSEEDASP